MILYFAGMESIMRSYDYEPHPTDHVFGTYFYKSNTQQMIDRLKPGGHLGTITIDSGAHSFFGQAGISSSAHHNKSGKKKSLPKPEDYFDGYVSWLKDNYEKIDYFVELDIQAIVGMEKVKEWRKRLAREGLFDKCIMVFHSIDSMDDFDEMISMTQSHYIGLEGLRNKKVTLPYFKLLSRCYDAKVKVHGFALTNTDILSEYPFYSADSTTWTASIRYGTFFGLDSMGMVRQKNPSKNNYFKYNVDIDSTKYNRTKDASIRKLVQAAAEFRKFETSLTSLWESRGVRWHGN